VSIIDKMENDEIKNISYNSSDNVSLELIYVWCDFCDRHYNNSKIILAYNLSYIKFHFIILFFFCLFVYCCLSCTLSMFLFICILLLVLHLFNVFFPFIKLYCIMKKFRLSLVFFLANQACKKILMEQNDILMKFTKL